MTGLWTNYTDEQVDEVNETIVAARGGRALSKNEKWRLASFIDATATHFLGDCRQVAAARGNRRYGKQLRELKASIRELRSRVENLSPDLLWNTVLASENLDDEDQIIILEYIFGKESRDSKRFRGLFGILNIVEKTVSDALQHVSDHEDKQHVSDHEDKQHAPKHGDTRLRKNAPLHLFVFPMADIFTELTDRKPTALYDDKEGKRQSRFIDFAKAVLRPVMRETTEHGTGEAINRALKMGEEAVMRKTLPF